MSPGERLRAPKGEPPANGKPPEAEILFQKYFKSRSSRTYAAQVKRCSNGNHLLVLTDGRRDPKTEDLRKSRVFVFSEDFGEFFRLLQETARFHKDNPVPEEVRQRRSNWRKPQPQKA